MRHEKIEQCNLYCGDCLDIASHLARPDATVTDPPYGIGAAKAKAHRTIRDNPAWPKQQWDDAAPDISFLFGLSDLCAIWGGNYFPVPPSASWLAWIKPEAGSGFSLADMELCWTNFGIAARVFNYARRDGNDHPTQKPVEVMKFCMSWIPQAKTILDPFAGSGSTGVAAVKLGKVFTGIERDEKYFDIMCRRIEAAYKQPDFFIQPAPVVKQDSFL